MEHFIENKQEAYKTFNKLTLTKEGLKEIRVSSITEVMPDMEEICDNALMYDNDDAFFLDLPSIEYDGKEIQLKQEDPFID